MLKELYIISKLRIRNEKEFEWFLKLHFKYFTKLFKKTWTNEWKWVLLSKFDLRKWYFKIRKRSITLSFKKLQ